MSSYDDRFSLRTTQQLRDSISSLKYELAHLKQANSGQASNYYAPAIHDLEQTILKRGEKV